jgi:FkbM family methyltransferase
MRYVVSPAILDAWGGQSQPPEQNMIEWAAQLLEPGKVFCDIGSHIGTYALQYAEKGHEVHAFEAQRETFYRLAAGILINELTHRVHAHHVALGDGSSNALELRAISLDGGGSSTIALSTHAEPLSVEVVESRTLDSYGIAGIGLIKIDVEGAELAVLKGAVQTLEANAWPKILFETWRPSRMPEAAQLRDDLFSYLRILGYRIVPLTYDEMFLAER